MIYSNGRFLKVSEKSGMGTSRWRCSQIQARNQATIDLSQQSLQRRRRPAILFSELCCFAVLFSNPPLRGEFRSRNVPSNLVSFNFSFFFKFILQSLISLNPLNFKLYYSGVQLGSPPIDFYVQIDTDSDIFCVSYTFFDGCPQTRGLLSIVLVILS
ncbi:hypothetical protein HN51_039233 [Arachis hypogaea]